MMEIKNPGTWMLSCQVTDHYIAGMIAYYNVSASCGKKVGTDFILSGNMREYFITAEEVEWDYGPSQMNLFDGGSLNASGR